MNLARWAVETRWHERKHTQARHIRANRVIHTLPGHRRCSCCRHLSFMRGALESGRCGSPIASAMIGLSLLISAFRLDEDGAIWLAPVASSVCAGRWRGQVRCRRDR